MKISDLLENDEWTSQPTTLEFLFKKQQAATHAFTVEINKLMRQHPKDIDLRMLSQWKILATTSMGTISSNLNVSGLMFPTLEIKYDRMLDAKNQFEQAGGKYIDFESSNFFKA